MVVFSDTVYYQYGEKDLKYKYDKKTPRYSSNGPY